MSKNDLIQSVMKKAEAWLAPVYDPDTRAEVKAMMEAEDKTPSYRGVL